MRPLKLTVALLVAGLAIADCGGGSRSVSRPVTTVSLLMATGPDSLDPAVGYNSEALEADWLAYTPLLTYAHARGVDGSEVIPGLATDVPMVTDGGTTYTLKLHEGLLYADGRPVKAGDFTRAVERAIRLSWPGARQFITSRIVGASAFADSRANTISGITTDDAKGQITIRLTAAYGAFEDVLALPALAPVPSSTPFRNEARRPPPGVGPYELEHVVPGRSFTLVKNPLWAKMKLLGIPAGHVNVEVKITGDPSANAASVLSNAADVFDWDQQISPQLLAEVQQQAVGRSSTEVMNQAQLVFLNVTRKPFSSQLAREAVVTGLGASSVARPGESTLVPACYLLPPGIFGHPHAPCPYADPAGAGNLAAARQLVRQSGTRGTRVTVWSEADSPSRTWMGSYTLLLNQLGFKARLRVVPRKSYYATIGSRGLHPQTGFAELAPELPDPAEFYGSLSGRGSVSGGESLSGRGSLSGRAVDPSGNRNWSEVNDPNLNAQLRILASVPASHLRAVASYWHTLDRYVADRAYLAVLGYPAFPEFVSKRINYHASVFNPVIGLDWSYLQLK
jgi:peptide/nickel transport system substrate-binding protein